MVNLPLRALEIALRLHRTLAFHTYSLFLFTFSDLKTILIPITLFACAVAPVHSISHFGLGTAWIWVHQLMCNVSNQARTAAEDTINKPWRPLPARRITQNQAIALRWIVVAICLLLSASLGRDLVLTTLGLLLTTFVYDEMGLSGHYVGKNLCAIGGYTTIEIGATKIMGMTRDLDYISAISIGLSGVLIFTTIQAQDFADVEGDRALGRVTFPIYAPELARAFTLLALVAWSWGLSVFWEIGPLYGAAVTVAGAVVGWRYYTLRTPAEDKRSYVLYNIWLAMAHILPIHARTGIFSL